MLKIQKCVILFFLSQYYSLCINMLVPAHIFRDPCAYRNPPGWEFHCNNSYIQTHMIYCSAFQPKNTHTGNKSFYFGVLGNLLII